jgi:hypothetical protein
MSESAFLKSNAAIDKAVNESTSVEEIRERVLATLAAQGTIVRDRTDQYGTRMIAQTESPAPQSVESGQVREDHKCVRVIYPHNNARIVLTGLTESELDALEAKIRAAVSSNR